MCNEGTNVVCEYLHGRYLCLPEGDECLPQAVILLSVVFKCVHFDCMGTGAVRNF